MNDPPRPTTTTETGEEEARGASLPRGGAPSFSRPARIVFWCAVALYVAARLWRLTDSCLWFDELFSVHAAGHRAWGDMLRFVAADVIHPPLFYALLKIWTTLGGESLLWLRLLPVLFSVAAVPPFVLLCRGLKLGAGETNLALLVVAANGYLIKYAQEVRMYAPLFALSVTSLWLFVRFTNAPPGRDSRRALAWLFLADLLLVYTHYYGWLVVVTQLAFLLARERRKVGQFLFSLAALALCFLPWVYAVRRASAGGGRGVSQNLGWIARPTVADAARVLTLMHEPFYFRQSNVDPLHTQIALPLGIIIFGVPLALLLVRHVRRRSNEPTGATGLLILFSLLPLALAFVLSLVLPLSVWGTRHLIVVAAPYVLLACAALWRVRPRWARASALAALACWFALVGALVLPRREGPLIWCAWDDLARRATLNGDSAVNAAGVGDATDGAGAAGDGGEIRVYAFEDLVAYHLWFALGRGAGGRYKITVVKNIPGLAEDPAYFLPRGFDGVRVADASALEGERLLVAFRDAAWRESRPPLKILRDKGYLVEDVHEFEAQGQRAFLISVRRR